MKMFYFSYVFINIILLISLKTKATAEMYEYKDHSSTNIFCADQKYNWEWLKENNKFIEVSGEWITYEYQENPHKISSVTYFKISGGIEKIKDLRKKCREKFGEEYIFAQPANNRFFMWYLLGTEDELAGPGNFYVYNICPNCIFKKIEKNTYHYTTNEKINLKSLLITHYQKE